MRLWNLANREIRQILKGHDNTVWKVTFSADGKTLASSGSDGTVHLWNPATGKKTAIFKNDVNVKDNSSTARSLAFRPDGETLASASYKEIKFQSQKHGHV